MKKKTTILLTAFFGGLVFLVLVGILFNNWAIGLVVAILISGIINLSGQISWSFTTLENNIKSYIDLKADEYEDPYREEE